MNAPSGYDRMIEQTLADIKGELKKIKDDISGLKTWRAFTLGGAAVITFILGMASGNTGAILHHLQGLP